MSCPGSSNSSRIQLLRSAACTIRFKGSRQQRSDYCGTGFRCQSSYKSTVRYLTSRPAPNKVAIHAKGRNGKNLSWAKCCFCIGVRRGPKQNLTLPTTSSPRAPLMASRFQKATWDLQQLVLDAQTGRVDSLRCISSAGSFLTRTNQVDRLKTTKTTETA